MTASPACDVVVTGDEIIDSLDDGRRISVPLVWFPRLLKATPEQRARREMVDRGKGVHWPAVDEDFSIAGLLRGWDSIDGTAHRRRREGTSGRPC